jgi:hypothetical protein
MLFLITALKVILWIIWVTVGFVPGFGSLADYLTPGVL